MQVFVEELAFRPALQREMKRALAQWRQPPGLKASFATRNAALKGPLFHGAPTNVGQRT